MSRYLFDNLEFFKDFKNSGETAIITDIDGTISEIASTPQEAVVTPAMHDILIKLRDKFGLLAVISGRSVKDAQTMVGVEDILYVGNHGLEYSFGGDYSTIKDIKQYLPSIKESAGQLNRELCDIEGILFEDKEICYSIHYRGCPEGDLIRDKIINCLKKYPSSENIQIKEGRKVVELKPPLDYDKGIIIQQIIEEHELKKVIYLGDDITDFDAFTKLNELEKSKPLLNGSIVVLSSEIPSYVKNSASFFVCNVNEVLKFFRWLLD